MDSGARWNRADADRESVFGHTSRKAPEYRTAGAGVTGKPGIGKRDTEWVSNQGWNQFRCADCGMLIGHGGSPCRCENPQPARADNRWPLFQEFIHAVALECLRVLRPGGHAVWFGGTRTYHRLACAIEDAGFEIRDLIAWMYGQGFPKSLNVALEYEKKLCIQVERKGHKVWVYCSDGADMLRVPQFRSNDANLWAGWGTAFKPSLEPICFARKPLIGTVADNVLRHQTGAINLDACRIYGDDAAVARSGEPSQETRYTENGGSNFAATPGRRYTVKRLKPGASLNKTGGNWRPDDGVEYTGTLKPGRHPANIVHDGSADVLAAFPDNLSSGTGAVKKATGPGTHANAYGKESRAVGTPNIEYGDSGSAARFFYTAKADADDRIGSKHPTVKPLDLKCWLARAVCPAGGTILDPFAGTGTTGEAAWREGFKAILIEREAEYQEDIRRRMALALSGPDERAREAIKAKLKDKPIDAGPLFGGT